MVGVVDIILVEISAIMDFRRLKMQNFRGRYLQVMERERCRYIDLKKSICNNEYQRLADTLIPKRTSATMNIKALQIHQLSKKHLRQQINPGYRYIKSKKSKSPHRSAYFNPRKSTIVDIPTKITSAPPVRQSSAV